MIDRNGAALAAQTGACAARPRAARAAAMKAVLAAAAALVALLAALSAVPAKAYATDVSTEAELRALAQTEGETVSVTLTADITLSKYWELAKNTKVTLDLNGHTLSRGLSTADNYKTASTKRWGLSIYMYRDAQLTIKDSSSDGSGKITGGASSNSAGAIYGARGNRIWMYGGSICNNLSNGGAVYLGSGTKMYLYGGSVENNAASYATRSTGAGIECDTDSQFYMYGGSVSGNTAASSSKPAYGAGIYAHNANVYIYGGTVSNNSWGGTGAEQYACRGGGIYFAGKYSVEHEFVIAGGTISDNSSYYGGGIWATHVTMTGGSISGNSAYMGGGICVDLGVADLCDAASYIKGGSITGNTAQVSGGALLSAGSVTITEGTITGNTTVGDNSGTTYDTNIYAYAAVVVKNLTLNGTGPIVISDNTGGDVCRYFYRESSSSVDRGRTGAKYYGSVIKATNLVEGSSIALSSECYSASYNKHPQLVTLENADLVQYFHPTSSGHGDATKTYLTLESGNRIYANPSTDDSMKVTIDSVTVSDASGTEQTLALNDSTGYVPAGFTSNSTDLSDCTVTIKYTYKGAEYTKTETGQNLSSAKTFLVKGSDTGDTGLSFVVVSVSKPSNTVTLEITWFDGLGNSHTRTVTDQEVGSNYTLSTSSQYTKDGKTYVMSGWKASVTGATSDSDITTDSVITIYGLRSEVWTVAGTGGSTIFLRAYYVEQTSEAASLAVTGVDVPSVGAALSGTATVALAGSDGTSLGTAGAAVTWSPADSTAGYNTAYTATIDVEAPDGVAFGEQADLTATLEGAAEVAVVRTSSTTATITATYEATAKAKATSVEAVAARSVAGGTAFSALGLPDTVTVATEAGDVEAEVAWASGDYKGSTAGTYEIQGQVAVPADYDTSGGVSGATVDGSGNVWITAQVTVEAASVAAPTASLASGAYAEAQTVELTCDTEGATVKYVLATDGVEADEATYSSALALSGAAGASVAYELTVWAEKDGVESPRATYSYMVTLPGSGETSGTVVSIESVTLDDVAWGTAAADFGLPGTVAATLSDGTTAQLSVAWDYAGATVDGAAYDPNTESAQTVTVTGAASLPDGLTLAEGVSATIAATVNVNAPVAKTTYTVRYGYQTVDGAGYDWEYFVEELGVSALSGSEVSIDASSPLHDEGSTDADSLGFSSQAAKVTYSDSSTSGEQDITESGVVTVASDGSTVVKLYFDRQSFDLYFDLNLPSGAESAEAAPATQELLYGATAAAVADPVLDGYEFEGWYTDAACSGDPVNLSSHVMPAENETLYAKWVKTGTDGAYISFWGGSLRMSSYAAEGDDGETTYSYDKADLRLGFNFNVPDGATGVSFGWYYGTSAEQVASADDRKMLVGSNSRAAGVLSTDPSGVSGRVANIVLTGVPVARFGSDVYAQMYVTYTLGGTTTTVTSDVVHRSVLEVANAISSSNSATSAEKTYAAGIIAAAG